MYYQATISTPANTLESSALKTLVQLAKGTITKALIAFPPGTAALLHVQVKDKGWQIIPWTMTESMAWDNFVYELSIKYRLTDEPYQLTIHTWNLDDSYDHTCVVGFEMDQGVVSENNLLQQYPLSEGQLS